MEQHAEDFEGFLVTEKRVQQLDALEGERQRTVKEWCTRMGQPTEYGDNILLQAIELNLKKPVQVFSYDSKDENVYMQAIACGILSKEETMEASSDRRRPQVSTFRTTTLSGSHTSNTNSMGPPASYQIRCAHVV